LKSPDLSAGLGGSGIRKRDEKVLNGREMKWKKDKEKLRVD